MINYNAHTSINTHNTYDQDSPQNSLHIYRGQCRQHDHVPLYAFCILALLFAYRKSPHAFHPIRVSFTLSLFLSNPESSIRLCKDNHNTICLYYDDNISRRKKIGSQAKTITRAQQTHHIVYNVVGSSFHLFVYPS